MSSLSYITGDLLTVETTYIVHQCNCITTYGKDLSAQVFAAHPEANTYARTGYIRVPGTISVHGRVINLCTGCALYQAM